VRIPSFAVIADPIYTIFNDMDEPFGIRDLQFLIDSPEPADFLPFSLEGFGTPMADFVLGPGASRSFQLPDWTPGNFFFAQGRVFDASFTHEDSEFLHGNHKSAPEPSSLALLVIGCLILIGIASKRRTKMLSNQWQIANAGPSASESGTLSR